MLSPKDENIFGGPPAKPSPASLVDFYGRDFIITPDVLIPRPETEMIIDAVLNLVGKPYLPGVKPGPAKLPTSIKIVDVGTGSGCIAITLKLEISEAEVTAVDISDKALGVAKQNRDRFDARINFVKSDLLERIDFEPDLVVANLPYVDKDWDWVDQNALSKEPEIALYARDHGLALIKRLIDQIAKRAIPFLVLEADPCQHEDILNYARKKGLEKLETRGFVITLSNPQVSH